VRAAVPLGMKPPFLGDVVFAGAEAPRSPRLKPGASTRKSGETLENPRKREQGSRTP
jgi:hypothetical protein